MEIRIKIPTLWKRKKAPYVPRTLGKVHVGENEALVRMLKMPKRYYKEFREAADRYKLYTEIWQFLRALPVHLYPPHGVEVQLLYLREPLIWIRGVQSFKIEWLQDFFYELDQRGFILRSSETHGAVSLASSYKSYMMQRSKKERIEIHVHPGRDADGCELKIVGTQTIDKYDLVCKDT